MPKDHKKPNIYLLSEVNVADAPTGTQGLPRKFSGIANSGKPFSSGGELIIADLSDVNYKSNVPALLLHDRAQRAGFGQLSVENHQLLVTGTLLDNQYGQMVAQESDAGFPWQMSVHISAKGTQQLGQNETAVVNGQTVTGPMIVMKNCSVFEISFTPTGVDNETSAIALSDDGTTSSNPDKDTTMTLEEALATIVAKDLEIEKLKAEKEALEKEKQEADAKTKAAEVDAQLSQAGFTKTEDGKAWNGVGNATINMLLSASPEDAKEMIGDLRAPSQQDDVPDYLLSEQHKPNGNNQDRQLSKNSMAANAKARVDSAKKYI